MQDDLQALESWEAAALMDFWDRWQQRQYTNCFMTDKVEKKNECAWSVRSRWISWVRGPDAMQGEWSRNGSFHHGFLCTVSFREHRGTHPSLQLTSTKLPEDRDSGVAERCSHFCSDSRSLKHSFHSADKNPVVAPRPAYEGRVRKNQILKGGQVTEGRKSRKVSKQTVRTMSWETLSYWVDAVNQTLMFWTGKKKVSPVYLEGEFPNLIGKVNLINKSEVFGRITAQTSQEHSHWEHLSSPHSRIGDHEDFSCV